mgnify:CR=1 FL=1
MKKFFLYTDGRTGSTAVCDLIGKHPELCCWQELFTYGADLGWLSTRDIAELPEIEQEYDDEVVTHEAYCALLGEDLDPRQRLDRYLGYLEQKAVSQGKSGFGFKALYNHASHWNVLDPLRELSFDLIHHMRLNLARKYISGIIARARGVYNSKSSVEFDEKVLIDVDYGRLLVGTSLRRYRQYDMDVRASGFRCFSSVYEDFLRDKDSFMGSLFEFLGVERVVVGESDWVRVLPDDLGEIIENMDEVQQFILDEEYSVADIVSQQSAESGTAPGRNAAP